MVQRQQEIEVTDLPRRPKWGSTYWIESAREASDYTHGLFRFPAKFHVPVVEWALGTYANGRSVLDPFTGSGTVQVEALLRGLSSFGVDIDPLSVLVARVKTTPLEPRSLEGAGMRLMVMLQELQEARGEIQTQPGGDIDETQFKRECRGVWVPAIPNIEHWFRRYVIVDLARLRRVIAVFEVDGATKAFLRACFAGIIRRVSNADPAPVSGLEVTSVQQEKNARRGISVFAEYADKIRDEVQQQCLLWEAVEADEGRAQATIRVGDAKRLREFVDGHRDGFSLVITSPPYCRSVEYSRRHRLELFWLGFVHSAAEHVELKHEYLGRNYVRVGDWDPSSRFEVEALDEALEEIRRRDAHRARAVHHYFANMRRVFDEVHAVMKPEGTFILGVGNSTCSGVQLDTADYLVELARPVFDVECRFTYTLQNHYMQYGLWNGEGIKQEHVLILRPRGG